MLCSWVSAWLTQEKQLLVSLLEEAYLGITSFTGKLNCLFPPLCSLEHFPQQPRMIEKPRILGSSRRFGRKDNTLQIFCVEFSFSFSHMAAMALGDRSQLLIYRRDHIYLHLSSHHAGHANLCRPVTLVTSCSFCLKDPLLPFATVDRTALAWGTHCFRNKAT